MGLCILVLVTSRNWLFRVQGFKKLGRREVFCYCAIYISQFLVDSSLFLSLFLSLGQVDASKTVFLEQSNTIVVTAGLYHSMQVIPKDRFGNSANIIQDLLTAEIRKVS